MSFYGPTYSDLRKDEIFQLPFNCFQFMTSQRTLNLLKTQELPTNLRFYVHANYTLNLAGAYKTMQPRMQEALNSIRGLPGSYVFHIGKCAGWKCAQCEDMRGDAGRKMEAIGEMVSSINCRGAIVRSPLLLENAAGQNSELGSTFESQRKLFEAIDSTAHIAFCEDTQHRFASGTCDFSSADVVDALFEEIYSFGKIGMIHLNDSKIVEGGHVDRHEQLTKGKIWELNSQDRARLKEGKPVEKLDSLIRIFDWADDLGIDLISETSSYLNDLRVVAKVWPEAV